jgi:hypothetical protein
MDSSSIELPGSRIIEVKQEGETIRVCFDTAIIIKTMTGSVERTKWQQAGELIFEGAELEGELPTLPGLCTGGDVGENVYTYRDMVPLPLRSAGHAHCKLRIEGEKEVIRIQAAGVRLEMFEHPKYIEHIRPE